MRSHLRPAKVLLILWLCFLARGLFYSAMLPLWEGYDEPFHFSFIQYVASHTGLPKPRNTPVSREVQASLHLVPLSWEQRLHAIEPPIYTEDSYWQLPRPIREQLQMQVRAVPPAWGSEPGTAPANYEAQQAPVYYWIMSVPLRLASGWPLPSRLLLVRALSVLLASLVVPIAWSAAKQFLDHSWQAAAIVAVIVCMPEFMIDIARAGNECLGVVLYSLFTLLLLKASSAMNPKLLIAAGLVLGIGLLTKAYFLLAIPAFLLIAVYWGLKNRPARNQIFINAAAGIGLALVISSGWYWRSHLLTGTWSGEQNNASAMRHGVGHVLRSVVHVNWISGIASILLPNVWFGGWSFLKLPKPIYYVFVVGIGLALLGVLRGLLKDRFRSPKLFIVLSIYAFFWLGLLYDVLLIYVSIGVSATPGWYMYAVVVPEVLLVAYGFYSLFPERWHRAILPAIATSFAVIDLYGTATLLVPYYTGLIAHMPGSDVVRPVGLSVLMHTSPYLVLSRLTANKPVWLRSEVMAILMVLYCAATFLAAATAIVMSMSRESRQHDGVRVVQSRPRT